MALLELSNVTRVYTGGGLLRRRHVHAVDGVSFVVGQDKPEIFAIIGESGSGKTTLARMMLNIVPPSAGSIRFRGRPLNDFTRLDFMRLVQPIFQNPFEAFNPLKRVDRYLFMTAHRFASGDAEQGADKALRQVGLSLAEVRRRFPHELSDASLRMSIVNLFSGLRDQLGVSIIYITHDLATAYTISDRIIIMRNGSVVEAGAARAVLDNPQHPYSQLLKSAVLSV